MSIWTATTDALPRFVVGAGAGASNALSHGVIGSYVDAHNDFLEFFATGGVLLAASYVVVIGWVVASIWRLHRNPAHSSRARAVAAVAFGAMGAFFVTSSFGVVSYYAALVGFAILVGLIRGMATTPGETCFDLPGTPVPSTADVAFPTPTRDQFLRPIPR